MPFRIRIFENQETANDYRGLDFVRGDKTLGVAFTPYRLRVTKRPVTEPAIIYHAMMTLRGYPWNQYQMPMDWWEVNKSPSWMFEAYYKRLPRHLQLRLLNLALSAYAPS